MKKIIIFNAFSYVKTQIKNLMSPYDVDVLGVPNSIELYNLLDSLNGKVDLLLIDINLPKDDAFTIMSKIRKTYSTLPIVILTTIGKRSQFIKGIQHGAVDYILLPLNEENFLTRTMKHLGIKNIPNKNLELNLNQPNPEIDFQQYLSLEFKRAVKGTYSLSIVMCTFFKIVEEFTEEIENEYILLNNQLYHQFKSQFWETDLFVKYGSQSFIGIFPFSDEKNTVVILNKIEKAFENIKIENEKYNNYNIENAFVTYPFDGSSQEDLLQKLSEKMNNAILSVKNNKIG
ncbi:response regulator [Clostridium sp.]